jgi:hypothetical protein
LYFYLAVVLYNLWVKLNFKQEELLFCRCFEVAFGGILSYFFFTRFGETD